MFNTTNAYNVIDPLAFKVAHVVRDMHIHPHIERAAMDLTLTYKVFKEWSFTGGAWEKTPGIHNFYIIGSDIADVN